MFKPFWMPSMPYAMNLQLFAEGADPDAGEGGEDKSGADDDAKDVKEPDKGKTFTQDDVTAIAAREAKRAREKLLKELGLDQAADPKSIKDRLGKLSEYEESQKSDLDKATGSVSVLTKERDEAASRAIAAERKAAALMGGVPAEKVDRYIKLAESYMDGDDDDFDVAIAAALKDFPVALPEKKGSAGAGANPGAGGKLPENNPGKAAAARRIEQQKRAQEALKSYTGR